MTLPAAPPVPDEINRPPVSRYWSSRKSRYWMVAPLATTVLAIPASLVLFWLFAISSMAFDSCDPPFETTCPQGAAAANQAATVALMSLLPVILVWTWPRSSRFNLVRWTIAAVYVGMVVLAASMIINIPTGR